jgi:hypothetical protein
VLQPPFTVSHPGLGAIGFPAVEFTKTNIFRNILDDVIQYPATKPSQEHREAHLFNCVNAAIFVPHRM